MKLFSLQKEKKKEILDSSIMFSRGYYQENINIFNEKLTNRLFSLQCDVENFIILLKYRQTKFDLKLAKNCFFSLQYHIKNFIFTYSYCIRKCHIYAKIRICRKTLLFYILLWNGSIQKPTKRLSFLSFPEMFVRRKFIFSCSDR